MQNHGKQFELSFKNSIDKSKIYYLRLKDSPASFGQDSNSVRFTASNPYDNFCFYQQSLFPLELKTTQGTSFSFPTEQEILEAKQLKKKFAKTRMIKKNQIDGLLQASQYPNIYAGFIFNFEGDDKPTVWMNIINFNKFYRETDKKSINLQDMQEYGCIFINKTKKKVHYSYEIENLLKEIIKEGQYAKNNI